MCLMINEDLTKQILEGPEEIEVYKELVVYDDNTLNSEFYNYTWQVGWNYPKEEELQITSRQVNGGCLHVYLEPLTWDLDSDSKEVKFKALKSDLVKAGTFGSDKSATFFKLYLSQEEYDKALGEQE